MVVWGFDCVAPDDSFQVASEWIEYCGPCNLVCPSRGSSGIQADFKGSAADPKICSAANPQLINELLQLLEDRKDEA